MPPNIGTSFCHVYHMLCPKRPPTVLSHTATSDSLREVGQAFNRFARGHFYRLKLSEQSSESDSLSQIGWSNDPVFFSRGKFPADKSVLLELSCASLLSELCSVAPFADLERTSARRVLAIATFQVDAIRAAISPIVHGRQVVLRIECTRLLPSSSPILLCFLR
jgi:hypothetical protein